MCGVQHSVWYMVSIQQMSAVKNTINLLHCVCACVHLGLTHYPSVFVFLYLCMSAHSCACENTYHSLCSCLHVFVCLYEHVDLYE